MRKFCSCPSLLPVARQERVDSALTLSPAGSETCSMQKNALKRGGALSVPPEIPDQAPPFLRSR